MMFGAGWASAPMAHCDDPDNCPVCNPPGQQAQPLTERVNTLIKHYSRPTGTSKDCSCTEASETVAVLDALRLTLERIEAAAYKHTEKMDAHNREVHATCSHESLSLEADIRAIKATDKEAADG